MSYLYRLAEEHRLRKGDNVIVLTCEFESGKKRQLYRYQTAASWTEQGLRTDKITYTKTIEPWDGMELVNFDNGD